MIRLFTAFPATQSMIEMSMRVREMNSDLKHIRWTPEENLHITLFFIGEVEERGLQTISELLSEIAREQEPFILDFEAIVPAGKPSKASMIWAKFLKSKEFSSLHEKLLEALTPFMTIEIQHKDPIPHCTLARMGRSTDRERLNLPEIQENKIELNKMELWKTIQSKTGVHYDRLASWNFEA